MKSDVDVIIIGAGAAGLAATIELQSTDLTFLILEARNRVGGRAHTDQNTFGETSIDLGASWIHSYGPNNVLYNYHNTFNIDSHKNQRHGSVICVDYDGKPFTSETFSQARSIYKHLDSYISYNKNDENDQSIEQVIQSEYERLVSNNGPVKRLVDLLLSGCEQYEAGDFVHLSTNQWGVGEGTGSDQWVSSGYGKLLEQIADKHNLPIQLNTLVTKIDTTDNERIIVTTMNNSWKISCRRVIITIPLGCLKSETILFEPPLPDWKRQAINHMGLGLMNKLILQFPQHFWDTNARSFLHACNERRGRFRSIICLPPPANILILFVSGIFARELEALTDIEILEHIMKFLRQIFPETVIPDPINYKFTRWAQDPLAYGSYSNFAVHSGRHTIEKLARETSNGRVQWAGEHANIDDGTEDWSYGCVHSAFQSGQRAAKIIRDQLYTS
ncbi:unnamed protein product [Adineta steineri]|uniref:Amine oxidase domain-containing protein n=1 Tax=Adineta steineri TaxID=433720 RepID=A0A815K2H0_9BILA|nr:unnamed protein product [Adineta steineri]CAF3914945.1 unnamed protein product [Adineta steineri]